jgi:hypothetical protein
VLALLCTAAAAQQPAAPVKAPAAVAPAKYRVEMVSVFGVRPKEEFLVVVFPGGGFAFKALDSLKTFVATLPRGSSLEWAPSCSAPQPTSPLATAAQLREFEEYCKEKGIQFVRIPSG